jgi:hypothetical protein
MFAPRTCALKNMTIPTIIDTLTRAIRAGSMIVMGGFPFAGDDHRRSNGSASV